MKNIFIRAALALLIAALFSCNPYKKIQQNDAQTDALRAKWVNDWVKLHPCPPGPEVNLDSVCVMIWSGMSEMHKHNDSVNDEQSVGLENSIISWFREYSKLEKKYDSLVKLGKVVYIPQSPQYILKPVEDLRRIQLLSDSVDALNIRVAHFQAVSSTQNNDCATQVKAANKEKTKWIWLFIASCVVIVGGAGLALYKKFY